jgi:hypothetical protein
MEVLEIDSLAKKNLTIQAGKQTLLGSLLGSAFDNLALVMRFFHTRSQPSFAHTGLFFWLHKNAWRKVMMNTTNMTKKINVNFYICKCMKEIKEIAMKN